MAKKTEEKKALENPEVLQDTLMGAENWIEKNPKTIIGIAGVLLLVVGGYFGFNYYKESQNTEAQKQMFQAIYYFEADSLSLALNGDGNNLGFIDIIEEFGFSDAAKLANYYAGVCYLKQGNFETAILYLEDFSSSDLLVQARAYCLLGDAHMELQKYSDAAKLYKKAANYKPNKYFSPSYWMKAALAYEKANDIESAKEAYQQVIDNYFDSPEYQNARKFKAKLEGNS